MEEVGDGMALSGGAMPVTSDILRNGRPPTAQLSQEVDIL